MNIIAGLERVIQLSYLHSVGMSWNDYKEIKVKCDITCVLNALEQVSTTRKNSQG
jgi:hypothetical protein